MTKVKKTPRGFQFYTGDTNWLGYGGVWARCIGTARYHFVELTNIDEACGRDNEENPTYVVELAEVDLPQIPKSLLVQVGKSFGLDDLLDDMPKGEAYDRAWAYNCFEYGAKAPLDQIATDNGHKGLRAMIKASYLLTSNREAHIAALSKPVNRIGASALEYMVGDLTTPLLRGIAEGEPQACLMGRIYEKCGGQTLGGEVIPVAPIREALDKIAGENA